MHTDLLGYRGAMVEGNVVESSRDQIIMDPGCRVRQLRFTQEGYHGGFGEIRQVKAKVLVSQSCPTLCNPIDCSLPGSSVHGILQASVLEWIAIFLLQGIFLTQGLNSGLPHGGQILYHLSQQGRRAYHMKDEQ